MKSGGSPAQPSVYGASPAIQTLAHNLWTLSDHLPYRAVSDNAEATWVWFKLVVFSARTYAELGLCVQWLGMQIRTPFRLGKTFRYKRWLRAAERATTHSRLVGVLHAASESAAPHEAMVNWQAVNASWCNPPDQSVTAQRLEARRRKALRIRSLPWASEAAVPLAGSGGTHIRSNTAACLHLGSHN